MLKVCKLDINWAAEGSGAERVGVCSCSGDVTGFGSSLAHSSEEAVDEMLSRRVADSGDHSGDLEPVSFGSAAASPV